MGVATQDMPCRDGGKAQFERAVDVSVEPDGGSAEHSGSLAGGSFQPGAS